MGTFVENINKLAGDLTVDLVTDITTVSANIADVNTVAQDIANVNITAAGMLDVNTVASNIADVSTVSLNVASIATAATNISDINEVVTTVVPNLPEILLADSNAAVATAKADEASVSAAAALASENSAASLYDQFDDRYLGAKITEPVLDNDGNTLLVGALYLDSVTNKMRVYGSDLAWSDALTLTTASISTLTNKTIDNISNKVGADHIHYKVRNESGNIIPINTIVAASGTQPGTDYVLVVPVSDPQTQIALGIVHTALAVNGTGLVINTGVADDVNTNLWSVGTLLYPSNTGGLTTIKPTSGRYQACAVVLRQHNTQGTLLCEFTEPHTIASTTQSGYVQLNDTLTSTSTVQALTAAQGKVLQDGKQPLSSTLSSIATLTTAADQMLYTTDVNTFAVTSITPAGRDILKDLDAAGQRLTLGLGNVDNTSDINKPISTATQIALDSKVDDSQVLTNVPLGAVFTDTVYIHPTTDGSLHVPATGTTSAGKVLTAGATDGTFTWEVSPSGVTDHTLLSNIGTNTHAQIDTALTRLANTSGTNTGDQDLSGYSLTTHNHTGVYEPADATILKDVDIGSTVQAYNANTTTAGNTFNGASQLVQTNATGQLPALDGSLLTNLPSGATTLDGLTDVAITTPVTDQLLVYNGTNWVNVVNPGGTDATKLPLAGGDMTGTIRYVYQAMITDDIAVSTADIFSKTISGATVLTVSSIPVSPKVAVFNLELTNGGSAAITWFSGVKWAGGTAPTLTASGLDILQFYTRDGGTTWRGALISKDNR